ncbi:NGP1NT-domain-containing protein [Mycena belliarum]|uniref:Nucleolar GTP-binding protein 2 n=1 Tax=Mycena belliarum TaxID=1033014 RepID=A0AAD6TY05_9AGAR|nr:NGP1NT-domain-containing protein [Mycena belliae]
METDETLRASLKSSEDETKPGRVQPDWRWFGNTQVISQNALDRFRTSLLTNSKDNPYHVLLRRIKLPIALLDDAANPNLRKRPHIVEVEAFGDTFGPKAQRKRLRIDAGFFDELSKLGAAAAEDAADAQRLASSVVEAQTHADYHEPIYAKGTSRRIYGELYKVIDSSDVVLHILDARDPFGTICKSVLEYVKKEKSHKQIVLVINKSDLVPNWVSARYIHHLTPCYPAIAFHASLNHSFGKGSLIQLLRQFAQLHSDKKQISVGFIGYLNVGKSSVIDTLKSGKVCRGVVRVEVLPTPSDHIPTLMARVKPICLSRTYGVALPDEGSWRLGTRRIPFFVPPPERTEELNKAEAKERSGWKGLQGADGEVPGVRQNLGTALRKNTYVADDVRPPDDLFVGPEAAVEQDDSAAEEKSDADDESPGPKKEPRMRTNKKKAAKFYSRANVKNKNRNKSKIGTSPRCSTSGSALRRVAAEGRISSVLTF